MMLVYGVAAGCLTKFFEHSAGPLAVVGAAVIILVLPPSAYWMFVLFFGQEAWPLRRAARELPPEERAAALLGEATKMEIRGRVPEALAKYQTVVGTFGGTAASHDAQKGLESLRAKIG